jgi:hypothetical protein
LQAEKKTDPLRRMPEREFLAADRRKRHTALQPREESRGGLYDQVSL